ncbi:MAG: hypothetical protein FJW66_03350 [Actinobacteria bacterium]|nr:hypothetical protein [Actinomycetota bacterium]
MKRKTAYILVLVSIIILVFGMAALCDQCLGLFIDTGETQGETAKETSKQEKKTEQTAEKETVKEKEEETTQKSEESTAETEEKKELTADLYLLKVFADSQPQGNVFIQILNNGPDELVNQKILVTVIEEKATYFDPPTASASSGPGFALEISVKPGSPVETPIGFSFDATQNKYRYEVTIEPVGFVDPNPGNNKAEGVFSK